MEQLVFTPTQDTPEVLLNKEKGIFKIAGNSFSEDPFTVYARVFSWIKEYAAGPNQETNFQFRLNYINTASSKQIVEILKMLEGIKKSSKVNVEWHYQEGDDDMLTEGQELSHMFNLDFDFIEY
jgi:hypothetical protein